MSQLTLSGIKQLDQHIDDLRPKIIDNFPVNGGRWDTETAILARFDSMDGWNPLANMGLDAEVTFEGRPTMRFSPGATAARGWYHFDGPLDLTAVDNVDVWMRASRRIGDSDNIVLLFSADGTNELTAPVDRALRFNAGEEGQWIRVRTPTHLFTGTGDLTAIDRLRVHASPVSAPIDYHIAQIGTSKVATSIINIDFDDHHHTVYDPGFKIMQKYGLPGTFFVITSAVGTNDEVYVTWDQLREMQKAGWLIGSHSHTHINQSNPEISDEDKLRDILRANEILKRQGFAEGARYFSLPYGGRPPEAIEAVLNQHTIMVRGTLHDIATRAVGYSPRRTLGVRGSVGANTTVEEIKAWIDDAVEHKEYLRILFHYLVDNPTAITETTPELFEEVCEYIADLRDAGKTIVNTPREVFSGYTGPLVESDGVTYVSAQSGSRSLMIRMPG